MISVLLQIVAVLFGLGFLIFIHELGHFSMAKLCKVKVLKFAFGFGKELWGFTKGDTRYSICLFPFGGMVAMAGDNPDEAKGEKDEFLSLPCHQKLLIVFFGPLMNYILAIFLFTIVFNIWGLATVSKDAYIGDLAPKSCAKEAGLMINDKIISINGVKINSWTDLTTNLKDKAEKDINITILRQDNELNFNFVVDKNPTTGSGMLGVQPIILKEKTTFFKSFYYACDTVIYQSVFTLTYLWDKLVKWEKPEIAGPIGVIQVMAKSAKNGLESYIRLLAVISVALGLFNLLPIPLVDGGMIVLFLLEGIIRKRISLKVVGVYNTVGLSLILLIFLFATYSDLIRLGVGKLFK